MLAPHKSMLNRDALLSEIIIATQAQLLILDGTTIDQAGEKFVISFSATVALLNEALEMLKAADCQKKRTGPTESLWQWE